MADRADQPTGATNDPETSPRPDDRATPEPTKRKDPLRRSRTSGAWVAVILLAVVLVVLIVFIAQNTQEVEVTFLGWSGQTPLALALLIAAAGGLLLAATAATLRMWQVRRRVRRGER